MYSSMLHGSAQLTGEAPGLQIRCGALKPSRVGSIPMHFRHIRYIAHTLRPMNGMGFFSIQAILKKSDLQH
jgi:hypothetical protein